jgi:hypothetical protein
MEPDSIVNPNKWSANIEYLKYIINAIIIIYMSILDTNKDKIRIVKPHYANTKLQKTLEFAIPKELAGRYELDNETYLMLVPEQDSFRVMKLRLYAVGDGQE